MATSRWGSFLTGLESKLDTILADDDPKSTREPKRSEGKQEQRLKNEAAASSGVRSRGDSMVLTSAGRAMDGVADKW
jgi:hypothetical protein